MQLTFIMEYQIDKAKYNENSIHQYFEKTYQPN